MKILLHSRQRNFVIDEGSYNLEKLKNFMSNEDVFVLDENFQEKKIEDVNCYDIFRISVRSCKEVKVIYNKEYGYYENVVITNNNTQITIKL